MCKVNMSFQPSQNVSPGALAKIPNWRQSRRWSCCLAVPDSAENLQIWVYSWLFWISFNHVERAKDELKIGWHMMLGMLHRPASWSWKMTAFRDQIVLQACSWLIWEAQNLMIHVIIWYVSAILVTMIMVSRYDGRNSSFVKWQLTIQTDSCRQIALCWMQDCSCRVAQYLPCTEN